MTEDVRRLGRDERRGLNHVPLGRVLLLDRFHLVGGALDEHVLKDFVQLAAALDRRVARSALVQDRHDGAVRLGLPDGVGVDEVPEDGGRLLLAAHLDGRAREADLRAVGQRPKQVRVGGVRVAAMRLVNHHEDVLGRVQHRQRLRPRRLLRLDVLTVLVLVLLEGRQRVDALAAVLLDHGKHEVLALAPEHLLEHDVGRNRAVALLAGLHSRQRLAGQDRRVRKLLLQIPPVRDEDDLEAAQVGVGPHLPHQEDHRQALPAALRVPDDAATPVQLAVLDARLARHQPLDRQLHRSELLVARDHLGGPAADLHEQREVADDVEQVCRAQHAGHQRLLRRQRLAGLPVLSGHLRRRYRARVLPGQVVHRER